jgi:hypothetical protein
MDSVLDACAAQFFSPERGVPHNFIDAVVVSGLHEKFRFVF